jgi:GNAT superfamily N-acetyltransferase
MTLTFSRMTVGDVDSAAAIALAAYGHPYGPHDIRRYLALQPDGWLMARIDGTPAAIGGITAYGNHAVVGLMATRPDFQRRGVATSLLATLLDYAGVWGVRAVALDATEEGAALSFKREASRDCGSPESLPLRTQRRLRNHDPNALVDLPPAERERFLRKASAVHLDREPPAAPIAGTSESLSCPSHPRAVTTQRCHHRRPRRQREAPPTPLREIADDLR